MSFDITESVTLVLPEIKSQLLEFAESDTNETKTPARKIIAEIAAIHEGLTSNYNHYSAAELEKSLSTWVTPYSKPIITNHDADSDPLGRVMASTMKKEEDGTPYIALQVAVTSKDAVERLSDKRYLTGSVGGKVKSAVCTICDTDWAVPSESGLPCKHTRGKVYGGKVAALDMRGITWKEYSFVNVPADDNSSVRSIELAEGDHAKVKVFALSMDEENIVELSESHNSQNILAKMPKKQAKYTYMNLKGTFLSATALDYKEALETEDDEKSNFIQNYTTMNNELKDSTLSATQESDSDEENKMATEENSEIVEEGEDDVLAVTDQLSADLASDSTEDEDEVTDEVKADELPAVDADAETNSDNTSDNEDAEGDAADHADDEEDKPEESDATTGALTDDTGDINAAEKAKADADAEIASLRSALDNLKEENTKLRKALHNTLVERVVDTKISLGLVEAEARTEEVVEHQSRSAASLADALRDLAKMNRLQIVTAESGKPKLDKKSVVVTKETNVFGETKVTESKKNPAKDYEDYMVDVFMGRKHL